MTASEPVSLRPTRSRRPRQPQAASAARRFTATASGTASASGSLRASGRLGVTSESLPVQLPVAQTASASATGSGRIPPVSAWDSETLSLRLRLRLKFRLRLRLRLSLSLNLKPASEAAGLKLELPSHWHCGRAHWHVATFKLSFFIQVEVKSVHWQLLA